MEYQTKDEGKALVVAFRGDIDLASSRDARKVLLEAVGAKRPVVVDLAGVDYIDSSGVASLVEALQNAKKGGLTLVLAAVSPAALRVLQLARLDKIFALEASVETALAGIG